MATEKPPRPRPLRHKATKTRRKRRVFSRPHPFPKTQETAATPFFSTWVSLSAAGVEKNEPSAEETQAFLSLSENDRSAVVVAQRKP